jgi:hypothetical protein
VNLCRGEVEVARKVADGGELAVESEGEVAGAGEVKGEVEGEVAGEVAGEVEGEVEFVVEFDEVADVVADGGEVAVEVAGVPEGAAGVKVEGMGGVPGEGEGADTGEVAGEVAGEDMAESSFAGQTAFLASPSTSRKVVGDIDSADQQVSHGNGSYERTLADS